MFCIAGDLKKKELTIFETFLKHLSMSAETIATNGTFGERKKACI